MTGVLAHSAANLAVSPIGFNVSSLVDNFWQLTVDGLSYGSIYALIAVGYTLVYGVLKLINFAHSEIFMLGMFGQYLALMALGFTPTGNTYTESLGITIAYLGVAMVAGMLVSGVAAVLLERVAYRPLRKRRASSLVFLITAIGASFAIQYLIFIWRGANAEPALIMFRPQPVLTVFGTDIDDQQLTIVVAALVLMVVADVFINRTRLGRGLRAVAQDPDTATLMGVDKERVIMLTFLVGGVLAGAASLFYVMKVPSGVQYNGGFVLGIKAFAAAVLGGIGNIRGALLGGLLLGVIGNYGQTLLGNAQWTDVVAFVVLVGILMVRPTGILGESLGRARV